MGSSPWAISLISEAAPTIFSRLATVFSGACQSQPRSNHDCAT